MYANPQQLGLHPRLHLHFSNIFVCLYYIRLSNFAVYSRLNYLSLGALITFNQRSLLRDILRLFYFIHLVYGDGKIFSTLTRIEPGTFRSRVICFNRTISFFTVTFFEKVNIVKHPFELMFTNSLQFQVFK